MPRCKICYVLVRIKSHKIQKNLITFSRIFSSCLKCLTHQNMLKPESIFCAKTYSFLFLVAKSSSFAASRVFSLHLQITPWKEDYTTKPFRQLSNCLFSSYNCQSRAPSRVPTIFFIEHLTHAGQLASIGSQGGQSCVISCIVWWNRGYFLSLAVLYSVMFKKDSWNFWLLSTIVYDGCYFLSQDKRVFDVQLH